MSLQGPENSEIQQALNSVNRLNEEVQGACDFVDRESTFPTACSLNFTDWLSENNLGLEGQQLGLARMI